MGFKEEASWLLSEVNSANELREIRANFRRKPAQNNRHKSQVLGVLFDKIAVADPKGIEARLRKIPIIGQIARRI